MNESSIYIYNLTRNVSINHLKEIFMNFGTLKDVEYVRYVEESMRPDKGDGKDDDKKEDNDVKENNDYNDDKKEDNNDDYDDDNNDDNDDDDNDDDDNDDDDNDNDDNDNDNDDDDDNDNDDNNICVHIKYENSKEAQTAKEFMDGGQIDGKIISVKYKINHKYIKTHKKKKKKKN
ncbi:RNA-binding protein s1, putative [Plasmodium reichenowi]|uniref:RNA-binding protein s1, putative n=1 Tax=Plasmodium reichenowi TaxID=5854 RepID=A0A151LCF1_PLARE|nr:RNA-binding protein s1, putative [Plasmodium reichenowi]KYN96645.1 RNA-binding protein s1, putative [Plasmodium reichenowi]